MYSRLNSPAGLDCLVLEEPTCHPQCLQLPVLEAPLLGQVTLAHGLFSLDSPTAESGSLASAKSVVAQSM